MDKISNSLYYSHEFYMHLTMLRLHFIYPHPFGDLFHLILIFYSTIIARELEIFIIKINVHILQNCKKKNRKQKYYEDNELIKNILTCYSKETL